MTEVFFFRKHDFSLFEGIFQHNVTREKLVNLNSESVGRKWKECLPVNSDVEKGNKIENAVREFYN